jgi:hypothetical protein
VTGDGSGGIAAGAGTSPSPAIVGSGTLTLDPNVVLVSAGSAPRVGPGITVATRTIPSLRADGAPIGGTVGVELFAPATAPYVLVVGLPAAPIPLPILFGSLWLDDAIVAATGAIPANGRATFSLPIPNDPFAFGHAFTWQAAADHRGVAVSNPSTYVHGF